MVKYFFQINDRVLVAITELKVIGNIIHKIGCRTSNALIGIKNSGGAKRVERSECNAIFKKGYKLERSGYGPFSLTSTICKILESIIRD